MKINKIQITNIIKEELESLFSELKNTEGERELPNPKDSGFKVPNIDLQMVSKVKKDMVDSGIVDFVKNNFPFKDLQKIEDLQESKQEKSYLKLGETVDAYDVVQENIQIMKNDRSWQPNFYRNTQILKDKLKELPQAKNTFTNLAQQREFLENWIKVFEMELAKSWVEKNLPTFKKFAKDNKEKISKLASRAFTLDNLEGLGMAGIGSGALSMITGIMFGGSTMAGPVFAQTMLGAGLYGASISFIILMFIAGMRD